MILLLKILAGVVFVCMWVKAFLFGLQLLSMPSELAFLGGTLIIVALAFTVIRLILAGFRSTEKLAHKKEKETTS